MKHLNLKNELIGILLVLFCSTSSVSLASESSRIGGNAFVGVRPSAMGHAYTAVADDQNLMFYNPAGLARLTEWSLEILNPVVGFNAAFRKNLTSIKDLASVSKPGSSGNTEETIDSLRPILGQLSGENNYAKFSITPSFVKKHFGLAFNLSSELDLVPHSNALPSILDLSSITRADARLATGFGFLDGKAAWGLALSGKSKGVVATEQLGVLTLVDISKDKSKSDEFLKDSAQLGWGVGVDVGFLFTPTQEMGAPTLGLAILNLGDVKFRRFKNAKSVYDLGSPAPDLQVINIGVSAKPKFGSLFVRPSIEFRDVNNPIAASQKLSLGLESGFENRWVSGSAQTGMSEGYVTAGFELRLLIVNLRYSTFVTERGYYPTQSPERRHLIGAKILL